MRRPNQPNQTPPQNWAEWLIFVGRAVHLALRRGAELKDVATRLHVTDANCGIALEFFRCSDVVKLIAMVEDWPLERIVGELLKRDVWLPVQQSVTAQPR